MTPVDKLNEFMQYVASGVPVETAARMLGLPLYVVELNWPGGRVVVELRDYLFPQMWAK